MCHTCSACCVLPQPQYTQRSGRLITSPSQASGLSEFQGTDPRGVCLCWKGSNNGLGTVTNQTQRSRRNKASAEAAADGLQLLRGSDDASECLRTKNPSNPRPAATPMCSPTLSHTGPIILSLSHPEFGDLLSTAQPSKGLPSAMQPVRPSLLLLHGASLLQQLCACKHQHVRLKQQHTASFHEGKFPKQPAHTSPFHSWESESALRPSPRPIGVSRS
eukprot:364054-Chlamydomonas_euryale.AAC.4